MNTLIKSNLFSNVVINKSYNGYNIQLEKDTNVFKAETAYSVAELLVSGTRLANILQWESVVLSGFQDESSWFKIVLRDMQYSKQGFFSNYKKFEDVAPLSDNLVKVRFYYGDDQETYIDTFGTSIVNCERMFNLFCHLHNIVPSNVKHKQLHITKILDFKSDYLSKDVFQIPDSGKTNTPMCDLDFYHWMTSENITNHHRIDTVESYLDHLGFDRNAQRVTPEDLKMLKLVLEQHFTDNNK